MQPVAGRPVCVLSVGRSGTSLATRALGLLGLDLGAEGAMLGANEWNRTGFWELQAMNDLNDEILAALGGSLWDPPDPMPGWEDAPEFEPLRARAATLLAEAFRPGARIAFKDTRTVHTHALWRSVVGPMDYVLCVRNPVEVVDSLEPQLPDRTRGELFAVWLRTTALALRRTEGERRLVLPYEDWFADPLAVARRLAAFVHGSPDALTGEAAAGIVDFFDPALRTRASGTESLAADDVPAEVGAEHFLLRDLARAEAAGTDDVAALQAVAAQLEWGTRLGVLASERRRAEDAAREHADRILALERERDALLADRTWLRENAAAIQAAHDEAAARLGAERDRAEAAEADAERLREAMHILVSSRSWRATKPLRAAWLRLRGDRSP